VFGCDLNELESAETVALVSKAGEVMEAVAPVDQSSAEGAAGCGRAGVAVLAWPLVLAGEETRRFCGRRARLWRPAISAKTPLDGCRCSY
jgi:hypothetical protein